MYDPQTPFSLEQCVNNCVSTLVWGLVFGLFLFPAEWARGKGQGKAGGMSFSCTTRVRSAEVSQLPMEEVQLLPPKLSLYLW